MKIKTKDLVEEENLSLQFEVLGCLKFNPVWMLEIFLKEGLTYLGSG